MDRLLYDSNTGLKWVNSSVNGITRFKYLKSDSDYDQTCRGKNIFLLKSIGNLSSTSASYRPKVTYLYRNSREITNLSQIVTSFDSEF